MKRSLALIISVVFHPVFTNLLSLLLLFLLFPSLSFGIQPQVKWFYIGFIFVTTSLFPLLLLLLLKFIGKRPSLMMNEKEERNVPYIVTSCLYLFDFYLARKAGAPILITAYLLACSSVTVALLVINQFTKISIHAASMGALMGVIYCAFKMGFFDIRLLLSITFVITGLVMSARLFMDSHSRAQIYSGFMLGLLLVIFIL